MKKAELLTITLGLVVLLAVGAFAVEAYPGQSNECGSCHSTTGALVLTSNATGTVDATVGIPFVLIVSQTDYSGGDGQIAVTMLSGWSDNDQFSFTEESVEDGDASDINPTADEVTVSFTLTPLAIGSWTLRVWTAGKEGMVGISLDVAVSVTEETTTTTTTDTTTTTTTDTTTTTTTDVTTTTTTESTTTTPTTTDTTTTGTSSPTQSGDSTLLTVALGGVGAILLVLVFATVIKKNK